MTHFDIGTLTDFLRDDAAPEVRAAIIGHMAAGCPVCDETLAATRALLAFGERHRLATPPDDVVQRARDIFPRRVTATTRSGVLELLAALVHDSFGAPALAGVRSMDEETRHIQYAVGTLGVVAMQLSYDRRRDLVTMVGQVDIAPPPEGAPGVVTLFEGSRVVAQATLSAHGEFAVEGPARRTMGMRIAFDTMNIALPLDALPPQRR